MVKAPFRGRRSVRPRELIFGKSYQFNTKYQRQWNKNRYIAYYKKPIYRPRAGFKTPYGFPPKMHMQLRYSDSYPLATSIGAVIPYQWRLNSLQDFDLTGAGHQPMFRDNMVGIYSSYKVIGVRIQASFTVVGAPALISVRATSESGVPTNIALEGERPGGKLMQVCEGQVVRMRKYFDIATVLGLTKRQYADDFEYLTPQGVNPAQEAILTIAMQPSDFVTRSQVNVQITATFYVAYYDLIQNQPQN